VVGAILAGGAGRRIGGDKAARLLGDRPLAAYPAAALAEVCERVALVCKPGTAVPDGWRWELWHGEPEEPRHPAAGIAYALERAGEPVLVCAADMPFVTASECRRLAAAYEEGLVAVVATADTRLQPVLGIYSQAAIRPLREAAKAGAPLRAAVQALGPRLVELPAAALESVDTPEDLRRATGSPPAR
jgi:molybdopterin-guanine dinucleotide biosynthesis protein A